jgi:quinol-cytochrome oxidoreductase complex cytochrome b subunit
VAILPAISFSLLGVHLLLVQRHGMSTPPSEERKNAPARRPMRFLPDFLLRDLFGWTVALAVLAALAAFLPWELGEKADPFAPAYKDIKPEWYFLFMFQTLKLVPGGEVAGIEYEALPNLLFGLAALLLVLVPLLDRGVESRGRSPVFTGVGILALAYMVGMTCWGYHSLLPVYVVVGTGILTLLLGLATGRPPGGSRP